VGWCRSSADPKLSRLFCCKPALLCGANGLLPMAPNPKRGGEKIFVAAPISPRAFGFWKLTGPGFGFCSISFITSLLS